MRSYRLQCATWYQTCSTLWPKVPNSCTYNDGALVYDKTTETASNVHLHSSSHCISLESIDFIRTCLLTTYPGSHCCMHLFMFGESIRYRLPLQRTEPFSLESGIHEHAHSASLNGRPRLSFFLRAWLAYTDSLQKRPLRTKCFATAIIFFVSDTATQHMDNALQWDAWRGICGAIFGVLATTYLHHWWIGLEIVCERIMPSRRSKLGHTAVKVLIDQGLGAPMYVFAYYTITNFFLLVGEGHRSAHQAWMESTAKASAMWWITMQRHWRLWPLVHSLNFYFVPLQHRVLVQNLVLVGWSGCKLLTQALVSLICAQVCLTISFMSIRSFAY